MNIELHRARHRLGRLRLGCMLYMQRSPDLFDEGAFT